MVAIRRFARLPGAGGSALCEAMISPESRCGVAVLSVLVSWGSSLAWLRYPRRVAN